MVNGGIGMINDWLFQKKKGAKLFIINIGCTVIHQPETRALERRSTTKAKVNALAKSFLWK